MPEYTARLCNISADTSLTNDKRAAVYLHFKRNKTVFRYAKIGEVPQVRNLLRQLEFDKIYKIFTTDNIHVIRIKEVGSEAEIRAENLSDMRKTVYTQ